MQVCSQLHPIFTEAQATPLTSASGLPYRHPLGSQGTQTPGPAKPESSPACFRQPDPWATLTLGVTRGVTLGVTLGVTRGVTGTSGRLFTGPRSTVETHGLVPGAHTRLTWVPQPTPWCLSDGSLAIVESQRPQGKVRTKRQCCGDA